MNAWKVKLLRWLVFIALAATLMSQLIIFDIVTKHQVGTTTKTELKKDGVRSVSRRARPNLIFIMTDQQQYNTPSIISGNNQVLHTPNMDRIAREGVHFTRAYTQCAVCSPARTSLLTGLTIENTHVRSNVNACVAEDDDDDDSEDDNEEDSKDDDEEDVVDDDDRIFDERFETVTTYDEYLVNEEGYVAEYYGKWHSPPKLKNVYQNEVYQRLFKSYRKYLDAVNLTKPSIKLMKNGTQIQSFDEFPYRTNPLDNRHGLPPGSEMSIKGEEIGEPDQHGVSEIPADHTLTAYEATQFLKALERLGGGKANNNGKRKQPFSLHLSLNRPHSPITPSEPYASMFQASDMVPPASIGDPMTDSPYEKANRRHQMKEYADPELIKYMIADYYAFTKEIDVWLGKIIDKIDELELASNTLLIYTSDHGEMLGAHGMREKNVFYEESVRIPLMIRFPGAIAPGTVVDDPVSHINVFATVLDYLGAKEQHSNGESLRKFIEEQESTTSQTDDEVYAVSEWNWCHVKDVPGLMVCTKRWKLFIPNTAASNISNVLYNLENDPHETNNLIGNSNPKRPFYLKEAERLKRMLVEWLDRVKSPHLEEVRKREL